MRFILALLLTAPLIAAERGNPSEVPVGFATFDALLAWTMTVRGYGDVECRFTGADPEKLFALVELSPYSGRATHHWIVWRRGADGWKPMGSGELREDDGAWEFTIDEELAEVVLLDQEHRELRRVAFATP